MRAQKRFSGVITISLFPATLKRYLRRYETRSTIMTSNRPLEDWGKLIGDVPAATAILDRFLHHAEVITITGKSYRLRGRAGNQTIRNKGAAAESA